MHGSLDIYTYAKTGIHKSHSPNSNASVTALFLKVNAPSLCKMVALIKCSDDKKVDRSIYSTREHLINIMSFFTQ